MPKNILVKDISPAAKPKTEAGELYTEVDLYERRQKIQPKSISGIYQHIRVITIWVTLGAYLLLPWLQWNDRQAILFDLPHRKFYIFDYTFWPQDFHLLSLLLICAALALFVTTVFAGRLYCGYACPQTVWTRIFMTVETFIEGDRHSRLKLDEAPSNTKKTIKRVIKHIIWVAISLLTAFTFVGYFYSIQEFYIDLVNFNLSFWAIFWTAFFTGATYINAGWMREQMCEYICPYSRFQSVMLDKNTLVISYDEARGEPRGKHAEGSCTDCGMCVQVCPVGIDIRDGLQYECINCAACVDACDMVMDRLSLPRGLVRYTTENALNKRKTTILRPRLVGYAAVLSIAALTLLFFLITRTPMEADIIRDRGQLYRISSDGNINNIYTIKIFNKSQRSHTLGLSVVESALFTFKGKKETVLHPGEAKTLTVRLSANMDSLKQLNSEVHFIIQSIDNQNIKLLEKSRFIKPIKKSMPKR